MTRDYQITYISIFLIIFKINQFCFYLLIILSFTSQLNNKEKWLFGFLILEKIGL